MFADQLVDDGSLKISLKAGGGQAAIDHMKCMILDAACEQDGIIGQRTAGGIRPAARAKRLVFALVVQFLPEQLFKAAQIPQVPEDRENRLLSFNLGHSSLPRGQAPRLSHFQKQCKFRQAAAKYLILLTEQESAC